MADDIPALIALDLDEWDRNMERVTPVADWNGRVLLSLALEARTEIRRLHAVLDRTEAERDGLAQAYEHTERESEQRGEVLRAAEAERDRLAEQVDYLASTRSDVFARWQEVTRERNALRTLAELYVPLEFRAGTVLDPAWTPDAPAGRPPGLPATMLRPSYFDPEPDDRVTPAVFVDAPDDDTDLVWGDIEETDAPSSPAPRSRHVEVAIVPKGAAGLPSQPVAADQPPVGGIGPGEAQGGAEAVAVSPGQPNPSPGNEVGYWMGQIAAIHDVQMWCAARHGDSPEARAELNAAIREGLDRLDGTPESSVALLAGVDRDRIGEYGGMPEGER